MLGSIAQNSCFEVYNLSSHTSNFSSCRDDEENMDDWDEDKLQEVVNKKHGNEVSNQTDIVST